MAERLTDPTAPDATSTANNPSLTQSPGSTAPSTAINPPLWSQSLDELASFARLMTKHDNLAASIIDKRHELGRILAESTIVVSSKASVGCITFTLDCIIPALHVARNANLRDKVVFANLKRGLLANTTRGGSTAHFVSNLRRILTMNGMYYKDVAFESNLAKLNGAGTEASRLTPRLLHDIKQYREYAEIKVARSVEFIETMLDPEKRQSYINEPNRAVTIDDLFPRTFANSSHAQADRDVIEEALEVLSRSIAAAMRSVDSQGLQRHARHSLTPEEEHWSSIPHEQYDHLARHVEPEQAAKLIKDGEICLICHMDYVKGEDAVDVLACGHYFHHDCWAEWLEHCPEQQDGYCGYCRQLGCWAARRKEIKDGAAPNETEEVVDVTKLASVSIDGFITQIHDPISDDDIVQGIPEGIPTEGLPDAAPQAIPSRRGHSYNITQGRARITNIYSNEVPEGNSEDDDVDEEDDDDIDDGDDVDNIDDMDAVDDAWLDEDVIMTDGVVAGEVTDPGPPLAERIDLFLSTQW